MADGFPFTGEGAELIVEATVNEVRNEGKKKGRRDNVTLLISYHVKKQRQVRKKPFRKVGRLK